MYETMKVRVRGLTPTVMHNGQLADPLNKWTKEIKKLTAKKNKKTDDDLAEIQRLEWFGGLYVDEAQRPCWPGENLEAMIRAAARLTRKGKDVERGVIVDGLFPVIHDGPNTLDDLFANDNFRLTKRVVVKGSSVMRTRPVFRNWELEFDVKYDPSQVNRTDVEEWLRTAFSDIGLSDWRPKYGRAEVVSIT